MKTAFLNGEDIHALTAAEINNTSIDKITPAMRRQAKTLNFGVLYGMGAKSFSETAQIPKDQAKNSLKSIIMILPISKNGRKNFSRSASNRLR